MSDKPKWPDYSTHYQTARDVLVAVTMLACFFCVIGMVLSLAKGDLFALLWCVIGLLGVYFQYMFFKVLFDIADHTRQGRDATESLRQQLKSLRPSVSEQDIPTPRTSSGPTRYNPKTHEYEAI